MDAATLRAELDRDFPDVDYAQDAQNPIMLKALLFAAKARAEHVKRHSQPEAKRPRLAEPAPPTIAQPRPQPQQMKMNLLPAGPPRAGNFYTPVPHPTLQQAQGDEFR